jgi:hypothetical protein
MSKLGQGGFGPVSYGALLWSGQSVSATSPTSRSEIDAFPVGPACGSRPWIQKPHTASPEKNEEQR